MANHHRRAARLRARLARPLTIVLGNLAIDLLSGRAEYYAMRAGHCAEMARSYPAGSKTHRDLMLIGGGMRRKSEQHRRLERCR